MSVSEIEIGVQTNGSSPKHIKEMALRAVSDSKCDKLPVAADIGGGRGDWALQLENVADQVILLDFAPPAETELPAFLRPIQADLNVKWPLADASLDFAFALEVIEHVENPRFFFRELARVTKRGGKAFLSTPNNHSLSSKLTFLLRGQHRLFQEQCYPAHITPLLICDFHRISNEVGFRIERFYFSNHDMLPKLHWSLPFGGKWFSDCIGVLLVRE